MLRCTRRGATSLCQLHRRFGLGAVAVTEQLHRVSGVPNRRQQDFVPIRSVGPVERMWKPCRSRRILYPVAPE
jgi:hypothetical protein